MVASVAAASDVEIVRERERSSVNGEARPTCGSVTPLLFSPDPACGGGPHRFVEVTDGGSHSRSTKRSDRLSARPHRDHRDPLCGLLCHLQATGPLPPSHAPAAARYGGGDR
jgi:hypothetical protein